MNDAHDHANDRIQDETEMWQEFAKVRTSLESRCDQCVTAITKFLRDDPHAWAGVLDLARRGEQAAKVLVVTYYQLEGPKQLFHQWRASAAQKDFGWASEIWENTSNPETREKYFHLMTQIDHVQAQELLRARREREAAQKVQADRSKAKLAAARAIELAAYQKQRRLDAARDRLCRIELLPATLRTDDFFPSALLPNLYQTVKTIRWALKDLAVCGWTPATERRPEVLEKAIYFSALFKAIEYPLFASDYPTVSQTIPRLLRGDGTVPLIDSLLSSPEAEELVELIILALGYQYPTQTDKP